MCTYFKSQKKKTTAIIAKDTRLSGYTLEPAFVSGLPLLNMHVYMTWSTNQWISYAYKRN